MTSYQCRSCKTVLDGMGIVCTGCGTRIRIPIRFADDQKRFLPHGMTLERFDDWLQEQEKP